MTDTTMQDGDKGGEQTDTELLFKRLKGWFLKDHETQSDWRRKAKEDFAFTSGNQLSDEDKARLREMNRPIIVMNRIEPVIDSVAGSEVSNRQEVRYIPRTQGDVQVNEVLTSAAKWFRDQCDAEDEESDAFRDTLICGMGWTETRLDYEDTPEGAPAIERCDPLQMVWDAAATKRNLVDMKRVFHIRRDIPIDEARALCPGDDFEDSDYNAAWVDGGTEKEPHHVDNQFYDKNEEDGEDDDKCVTMVRAQWWERVPVWMVLDPTNPDNILTLDKDQYSDLQAKAKMVGVALKSTKGTRKVYKQAFLGAILLEIGEAPCKDHFSFKAITGKRDRNNNTWYGLVRAMKDPQRWANKWMSQTMHIMNTSAKGGILAERGFFENDADAEATWARQDAITWARQGALSGTAPKFTQKPQSEFPTASYQLMQFAISSIRDVSGVNVEVLGLQSGASQAASLDMQRKQSAMTILQPLFDSLRRYRKEQGRLLLYLIENYLSDGRLIRIVGKESEQYVPLIRQPGTAQYDVIVDEQATSANQKEQTWAFLQQILPVIGKMLPPQTWLTLLKYSPLPSSAQKDISESVTQSQQGEKSDPEADKAKAEIERDNAKTQASIANDKALSDAKIAGMEREFQAKQRLELTKAAGEALSNMGQPQIGPNGEALPAPQQDGAAAVMAMLQTMQQGMQQMAEAISAPKRVVRDPQTGEVIGTEPVRMN